MRLRRAVLRLALLLAAGAPALAQAEAPSAEPQRWRFEIEPYVWIPDLTGEGTSDDAPEVDLTIDYPGGLSAALPLALRVDAPGPSSYRVDVLYARWTDDESSIETESELSLLELGYGYALAETFDLTAGVRAIELALEAEVGGADADASESWLDPWLGGRGRWPLAGGWSVLASADAGGFGVGSDFTWQAASYLGWAARHWRVDVGYRALAVDYDDGDLAMDLVAHGPLVGVGWRW